METGDSGSVLEVRGDDLEGEELYTMTPIVANDGDHQLCKLVFNVSKPKRRRKERFSRRWWVCRCFFLFWFFWGKDGVGDGEKAEIRSVLREVKQIVSVKKDGEELGKRTIYAEEFQYCATNCGYFHFGQ